MYYSLWSSLPKSDIALHRLIFEKKRIGEIANRISNTHDSLGDPKNQVRAFLDAAYALKEAFVWELWPDRAFPILRTSLYACRSVDIANISKHWAYPIKPTLVTLGANWEPIFKYEIKWGKPYFLDLQLHTGISLFDPFWNPDSTNVILDVFTANWKQESIRWWPFAVETLNAWEHLIESAKK